MVSFMPQPLFPLYEIQLYPLDRRPDGSQEQSELQGEVKILTPTGLEHYDMFSLLMYVFAKIINMCTQSAGMSERTCKLIT
jgi:hypothetical protein